MAEVLFDVKQGRRVYTASGALSTGMLVTPHSTAGQVVAAPATGPICMVAVTDALTGTDVEVIPITRGAEYRFLLAGTSITAGAEVEFGASGNIGKVVVFSSGTKVGRAQEAAAAGGLVKVIAY
jgi:hypothetical protein